MKNLTQADVVRLFEDAGLRRILRAYLPTVPTLAAASLG